MTDHYPGLEHREGWDAAWEKQKRPGEYNVNEYNVSDLVPSALGHCIRKNILVFNVADNATEPVHVFPSNYFHEEIQATTEIPVIIVYDGNHYESLLPVHDHEIVKCVQLTNQLLNKSYDKTEYGFSDPLLKKTSEKMRHLMKTMCDFFIGNQ